MLLSVTPREFATILAALRYWQAHDRNTATKAPEYDIASDSGDLCTLTLDSRHCFFKLRELVSQLFFFLY